LALRARECQSGGRLRFDYFSKLWRERQTSIATYIPHHMHTNAAQRLRELRKFCEQEGAILQ
jgi:hypothetical protein